jgi:hypothetical protein
MLTTTLPIGHLTHNPLLIHVYNFPHVSAAFAVNTKTTNRRYITKIANTDHEVLPITASLQQRTSSPWTALFAAIL